jgi:uncharacterized membrane protein
MIRSTAQDTREPRRFAFWVAVVTLGAALLRFTRLGAQSIWIDEGMSIAWIDVIANDGLRVLLHNIHGPLHAAAIYATSRISESEWWLRLPSAVAGVLTVPLLAHVGRRLWGARVGLTAATLLALSPFALYYAQEVRGYAFAILFATTTLGAAWAFAVRPRVGAVVGLVVSETLGILSNLNGIFLALGVSGWLIVRLRQDRRALLLWFVAHALVAVALLPYALRANQQIRPARLVGVESDIGELEPLRGRTTLHPMSLPYTAYAFAAGYSLGPTLEELRADPGAAAQARHLPVILLVVIGFGVPLAAGVTSRKAWPAAGLAFAVAASVVGFTLWLAATNMKPYNVRYLSVLLPLFLLFCACGLLRLGRGWRLVAGCAALVVSVWSCSNYLFVPRYGRDDTRGVVEYVLEAAAPEDLVLHINLGYSLAYYDQLPQRVRLAGPGSGASRVAAREYLDTLLTGVGTLWYLESRPEKLDPQAHLRDACHERASESETSHFVGIRVHRFELQPGP